MFSAETDKAVGIPVTNEPYPSGEPGIQKSLGVVCKKIREGAATAVMKSYAGNVLRQAGLPRSTEDRAAVMLQHIRKNVAYAHDALGTEQIQSAAVSLCVDGAPICIPIGDCFPEGTLLLRNDYQLVPIEEIKVGERIWGLDKWVRVEAKVFRGKLKVDAIEMNNGSTMYLTSDHKVYVGRCKHGKSVDCATCGARPSMLVESWDRIRVGDLQVGESLLQPERIAFGGPGKTAGDHETYNGNLERLYVEGLAISEGWVDGNRFCISGQDGKRKATLKDEVESICTRLGVATSRHRKYIRVNDPEWATRVASFGHLARNKHFETLNLDEAEAAAVLRGIMSDSTANTRGEGRTFSTTSHALMVQVRVLQRMFGRSTSVKMLTPEQHRGAGKHPLWRVGVRVKSDEHELSRNDKTLAVRSIERAVKKVPCWDIQTEDNRVYLPEHDVTVSQCDDLVTALGTLCGAAGMEVAVVRQFFGAGHQQHVLVEVKLDNGKWFPLDPSSSTMPAGTKARAVRETRHSPWDETITGLSSDAQFVGIGSLPVFVYGKEGWRQVREFENVGLGDGEKRWYPVGQGVEAPLPAGKVVLWEGGWWYRDPASGQVFQWTCCQGCAHGRGCGGLARTESRGLGTPIDDALAAIKLPSTDPYVVMRKIWAQVQGRSWEQAISSANARAIKGNWIVGDVASKNDLITLLVSTGINVKQLADHGESARADDLLRTWRLIAQRMGIGEVSPSNIETIKGKSKATGNVEVFVPVLIAAVIAEAVAAAAVLIALMYFASQVVDDVLSKVVCDRELARLHAEYNQVVERHNQNPNAPWSPEEKKRREELVEHQKFVAAGCVKKPKTPFDDPWPYAIGAGILGATVLGVVYRREIGDWIEQRRMR